MKLFYVIFFTNVYQIFSVQKLYNFVPERCDASNVNYSFFTLFSCKCNKINRNTLYLNVNFTPTINLTYNNEGQVYVQTYMFRSNEYRRGPIEFEIEMCSALTRTDFDMENMRANSNLKCPIMKDHHYYISNFSPNATNFPPLIPEGRWKIELVMKHNNYTICNINWYLGIVYPVRIVPGV